MLLLAQTEELRVTESLSILSLAITLGLALGAIRFRGMRLGISGVLFAALVFGHFRLIADVSILRFVRDFSLIIFIYALGLQVGPGFLTSLRAEGLRLNVLAVAVLVVGALLTAAIVHAVRQPRAAAPGIYAGAFTTTPGLAAGQEVIRQRVANAPGADQLLATASLAYSVGYPFGVLGPILVIIALRRMFGVDLEAERKELQTAEEIRRPPIEVMDFEVTQPQHAGIALKDHPLIRAHGVVLSRLLRDAVLAVPTGETEVRLGDVYRAVGTRAALSELVSQIGRPATGEFRDAQGDVERVELVVTRTAVLRRSLRELDLIRRHGVTVARVNRAGIDLVPKATLRLSFADRVTTVGPAEAIKAVEAELGNSPESLNRPQLIPIFLGIVLGVLVGSIPLPVPGLNTVLRIGLAGGPLLAAIILSQWGNLGSIVWYMPVAANALFRDFGLAVFLACVGLEAGGGLVHQVVHGGGLSLMLCCALVTTLPVMAIACLARIFLRMNFVTLSGWIAGAMTSSPALSFANDLAGSDAPAVAYAAVAPLATLAPILCAQVLAMGS